VIVDPGVSGLAGEIGRLADAVSRCQALAGSAGVDAPIVVSLLVSIDALVDELRNELGPQP
jgi:hypothetical protein